MAFCYCSVLVFETESHCIILWGGLLPMAVFLPSSPSVGYGTTVAGSEADKRLQ